MAKKIESRELGLILGLRLLKTEDLHYGYWTEDLEVTLQNLPKAQAQYTEFLLGHIPHGVKTVLDVGCGSGHVAQILTERGYQVECLSPSGELNRLARERLGGSVPLYSTPLEEFQTERRYDLVLFSESFQYIPLEAALSRSHALLNAGGHVLISDFFRIEAPGKSPLKGGHELTRFYELLTPSPFAVVSDEDITAHTAPNLDLVDTLLRDYAVPIWDAAATYLSSNHPWLSRLGWWIFGRKLGRLRFKYFSRQRTGEAFARHKSYRCVLLRRKD